MDAEACRAPTTGIRARQDGAGRLRSRTWLARWRCSTGPGLSPTLTTGESDPALLLRVGSDVDEAVQTFAAALAAHRHYERETDPPLVRSLGT